MSPELVAGAAPCLCLAGSSDVEDSAPGQAGPTARGPHWSATRALTPPSTSDKWKRKHANTFSFSESVFLLCFVLKYVFLL